MLNFPSQQLKFLPTLSNSVHKYYPEHIIHFLFTWHFGPNFHCHNQFLSAMHLPPYLAFSILSTTPDWVLPLPSLFLVYLSSLFHLDESDQLARPSMSGQVSAGGVWVPVRSHGGWQEGAGGTGAGCWRAWGTFWHCELQGNAGGSARLAGTSPSPGYLRRIRSEWDENMKIVWIEHAWG